MASFTRRVSAHALRNTLSFFGDNIRRSVGLALLSTALGTFAFWRVYGWDRAMDEFVELAFYVFRPMGLLSAAIFLWYLMLAPAELVYEAITAASRGDVADAPAQNRQPTSPNWAIWRTRDSYLINELAALLAGNDPSLREPTFDEHGFRKLIMEHVRSGKLKYIPRFHRDNYGRKGHEYSVTEFETYIQKVDAIPWAEANGFDTSKFK